MKLYHIALCESRETYAVTHKKVSWAQLAKRLLNFKRTTESQAEYLTLSKDEQLAIKDCGGFIAGSFKGFQRRKTHQLARCLLTLDLDEIPVTAGKATSVIRRRLKDMAFVCHSTHKHTDEKPRLRIVIPLDRETDALEHEALARRLAWYLDQQMEWVDRCSFDYTRVMFWPSASVDGETIAFEGEGQFLPVDQLLAEYDDWRDPKSWPRRENEDAHVAADEREDPRTKRGILGAFCRAYDIPRALDELIPGIYVEEDSGRFHYAEGTTAGGARIYATSDGFMAFLHSEHDTDPARGQHNAWDLVRIHLGYDGAQMEEYAQQLEDVASELTLQVENEFDVVDIDDDGEAGPGRYDWLKPWVYVKSAGQFYCAELGFYVGAGNFDAIHAADAIRVSGKSKRGTSTLTASEIALQQRPVPQVHSMKYRPGAAALFDEQGVRYANAYRDDSVKALPSVGSQAVALFHTYLDNILPLAEDQAKLLDWLAHVVRFPDQRLMYAVLLRGAESDGKTLISELLRWLVGPSNWGLVTNDEINEKYSAWMENRRAVCIEEIKQHGQDALDVINRLKPKITNMHISVRAMRQDSRVIDNYANLYLTTNFADAIPITAGDSRFLVLSTRFNSKQEVEEWADLFRAAHGFDFYPACWRALNNAQGAGELRQWLAERPFSEFYDPDRRAPDTLAKTIMVEASLSEADQALLDLLEDEDETTVNHDFVVWGHFVMRALAKGYSIGESLKGRAVSSFMNRHGYIRSFQLREGDKRQRVWVKNRAMLSKTDASLTDSGQRLLKIALKKRLASEFS